MNVMDIVEKMAYRRSITTRMSHIDYEFKSRDNDNGLFAMYFMESYNRNKFSEIKNLASDWHTFNLFRNTNEYSP